MAAKLDRTRDFGEVTGGENGARYYQDDKPFDCHGDEIVATGPDAPAAPTPAHPKHKAKAPAQSADDQLASQLAAPK